MRTVDYMAIAMLHGIAGGYYLRQWNEYTADGSLFKNWPKEARQLVTFSVGVTLALLGGPIWIIARLARFCQSIGRVEVPE